MKKLISVISAIVLILSCCGCSGNQMKIIRKESVEKSEAKAEPNQKYDTYTGLAPLPKKAFNVKDPENSKGISEEKIEHSFGVAKDGKPNEISIKSQEFFDSKKYNAVTYDTRNKKSLYLTFDCGYENGYTEKILKILKEKKVPAAFFCTYTDIRDEPELIAKMINEGHIVGNHSTTHPSFAEISREKMAKEIKQCDDFLREKFGYTSAFFRFPKGEYSESSLENVNALGYKCIFWSLAYSDWDTNAQKGRDYAFDMVTSRLHPGAIILLHSVSSDNAEALPQIIDYAREQGYTFKSLNDLQ